MPYARFEQILLAAAGAVADARETQRERGPGREASAEDRRAVGTAEQHAALGDAVPAVESVPRVDPVEHAEQIERWLRGLDVTLATASEIVDRGREAFREDAALPLACEALTTRVGELARLLVAADPDRFDDPMWSLVARSQEIVVQHYSRVDEQMMWVTVAEGFPEIEDLVQGAREGADAGVHTDPGPLPLS